MNHPPYAADTRAKGWRFELDHERIRRSDTWALARPDLRPWLLMLWMVAWEQAPCGSLPNDDGLIAARIDMPTKVFAKHRPVLMRGWMLADDGRLYHPVISERVLEMVDYREKAAARKAAYRDAQRSPAPVPRDSSGTNDTGTGTGTGTGTKEKEKRPRKARATHLPEGFEISSRVHEWAKQKGFDYVERAAGFEAFMSYVKRKGAMYVDWDEALMTAIREDWAKTRGAPAGETAYQRSMRERVAEIHPALARPAPGQAQQNPMEVLDGLTEQPRLAR